jgi:adenylate cyclase
LVRVFALSYGLSLITSLVLRNVIGAPIWLAVIMYGTPFGICFGTVSMLRLDELRLKSYLATVLVRVFTYMAAVFVAFFIALLCNISLRTQKMPLEADVMSIIQSIVTQSYFQVSGAAAICIAFLTSSLQAISRKLGPGVLTNWLRGYYHEPREETRIFMFLDMKDSTTLAEALGHMKFSALVRDFMADLTGPVLATKAEVSHYIGDEAVITWQMELGLANASCLRFFFLFQSRLESRRAYYERNYGLLPGFKAGAHFGKVVTTEVGEIKSEIVYHGDVLNTAARIQGMCAGLGEEFLISGELAAAYEVTSTEIALAFLLKHPSGIVPIVGSTRPEKIRQAVRATEIELSREDWYRLLVAARQAPLP